MAFITISSQGKDITLAYQDVGQGDPIILIHGWPLSHRAWDGQTEALVEAGYRVIAYDRRGFGASDKPYDGYDYTTLASDLKGLIDALQLRNVTIAGFSMGGGEVARYLGEFGSKNIKAAMLISAVTPFMLKTDYNPKGLDASVFEEMRTNVEKDRFAFISQWRRNFLNADDASLKSSPQLLDYLLYLTYPASPKAMKDCITAFGETDFREDCQKIDVPLLIVHGTNDNICPADVCGKACADLVPHARLELFDNAPHGLNVTHKDKLNKLMVEFLNTR